MTQTDRKIKSQAREGVWKREGGRGGVILFLRLCPAVPCTLTKPQHSAGRGITQKDFFYYLQIEKFSGAEQLLKTTPRCLGFPSLSDPWWSANGGVTKVHDTLQRWWLYARDLTAVWTDYCARCRPPVNTLQLYKKCAVNTEEVKAGKRSTVQLQQQLRGHRLRARPPLVSKWLPTPPVSAPQQNRPDSHAPAGHRQTLSCTWDRDQFG